MNDEQPVTPQDLGENEIDLGFPPPKANGSDAVWEDGEGI